MIVAKISEEKSNELKGKEYQNGMLYNPVKDKNKNWIVSLVEAQYLLLEDFEPIEFEADDNNKNTN